MDNGKNNHNPNPAVAGRLDVLAQGIVDRIAQSSSNPVVQAMYPVYRDNVHQVIEQLFAPRTASGRIKKVPRAAKVAKAAKSAVDK